MPTCALIRLDQGIVENLIIASSTDPVPEGYLLIENPPDHVRIGTPYQGDKFVTDGITVPRQDDDLEFL